MAFLTRAEAVSAARRRWGTRTAALYELREAASAPYDVRFDVFLSHAYRDGEVILGVREWLEADGLTVYVDWIDDPQTDRKHVTPETADMLRRRMRQCRFLLYATSPAAPQSRWMPWELGYFDGRKPGHVGIFPVVEMSDEEFQGLEYLGLYPVYQPIRFDDLSTSIATYTGFHEARTLLDIARS